MFSISACKWRNGWTISVRILSISAGKNPCLLEHPLKMKKINIYFSLYVFSISACRWRNGWTISLRILSISAEKFHFCWNIPLRWKKSWTLSISNGNYPFLLPNTPMIKNNRINISLSLFDFYLWREIWMNHFYLNFIHF